ncbi:GFA family protein [Bordetella petrii]|uniref:GFA family protein n=1 Tax=Bordetella petrii TaxID=94624 RepID=UPI001E5121BE|nr:GFA family protein [Bordetella petrii]MCD0506088.1 GFA family protein [Bordetella petrii]
MVQKPSFVPLTGGCQCGAVRYEITAEPMTAATCHCRDCQYASGGAPAHALLVAPEALRILQGRAHEHSYMGDSGNTVMRSFCQHCGTPLFGGTQGAGYAIVKAGSLDDPEQFRARLGLWTESAPSWHHIDTTIPSFGRNSPG